LIIFNKQTTDKIS